MANGTNWSKAKKNAYQKAWYRANNKKTNINAATAKQIFQASQQSKSASGGTPTQAQPPATQTKAQSEKKFSSASDANKFWGVGVNGSDWQNWKDNLNGREKGGITRYTGSWYGSMNNHLRLGDSASADVLKAIDGTRSAIAKANLNQDIVVYRGCSSKIFGGNKSIAELKAMANNNEVLHDKGFGSSAITMDKAWGSKGYVMEIHVPAGQGRGQWVAPMSSHTHEDEYLIHDNAHYIVTGARMENGKKVVTVELLK